MNKQKQALEFLKQNADVLEEALLYWSAKEYNVPEEGDSLIAELFEIVGIENDLKCFKKTDNAALFQLEEVEA